MAPSQLHPNSWAMVRAFEILCLFFNIRPNVLVFFYFFPNEVDQEDWLGVTK